VRNLSRLLVYLLILASLNACSSRMDYAPVSTIEPLPKNGKYRVAPDETLYSIAWRYGLDYRDLAKRNRLPSPYHVKSGQLIYLTKHKPLPPPLQSKKMPAEKPHLPLFILSPPVKANHFSARTTEQEPTRAVSYWHWPARGVIIGTFSSVNKGINISGYLGQPILATAAGRVVYSGHGLRGYGNLIIIKHNSIFLTAYAHNKTVLVKEGAWVKMGQKIAEMGNAGTQHAQLHFEIRRNGQPVNPLIYLNGKV
jgi:lipoprotein NlpD